MTKINDSAEERYDEIIVALNNAAPKSDTGRRDFREITEFTGLKSSWLSQLADKIICDAGYKKLYVLKVYLYKKGYLEYRQPVFEEAA